ncbi:MAG: hypothetical protein AB7F40_04445 [Victivallaceae bacterium]
MEDRELRQLVEGGCGHSAKELEDSANAGWICLALAAVVLLLVSIW